jgi:hypothetical protein
MGINRGREEARQFEESAQPSSIEVSPPKLGKIKFKLGRKIKVIWLKQIGRKISSKTVKFLQFSALGIELRTESFPMCCSIFF